MSELRTESGDYCSSLVREQDEDRWLAIQYAKEPLRSGLLALAALRVELRRVPSQVSEAPLGEIRLQWWREGLEGIQSGKVPRVHPVLEAIAPSLTGAPGAARLDDIIDASSRPLYGERFTSVEELSGWLMETEGAMDALAVEIAGGDAALAEAVLKAGTAFALAREGGLLEPKLAGDIHDHAMGLYRESAPALAKAAPEIAPANIHLALTPLYLRAGPAVPVSVSVPGALRKRMKLFSAMAFARF